MPTNEINYSDIGKKIQENTETRPLGIMAPVKEDKYLMPTINLSDYRRYTASDAFPKIGIDPNLSQKDMERQYDAAQSYGEAFGNTMGKLWNTTANSFVDFFRADFSTNDSLIKHMYKELEEQKNYDIFHPNFDSRTEEEQKSFLQWVPGFKGSLDNYEQFLPNLGYTVGMMGAGIAQSLVTGAALNGLGALAGGLEGAYEGKKMYDIISGLDNFKTGMNAINTFNKGNKLIKGLQIGLEGYSMWSAFQSEAAMEAANTGQSTYEYLVDKYSKENGLMPVGEELEKIKETSYKAAKTDYWMNAPILLLSNFIQFSKALMPVGSKVMGEVGEEALKGYKLEGKLGEVILSPEKSFRELWKDSSKLDRFKLAANSVYKSLEPMKNTLSEGMEESLQRFSSTFSQDYYVNEHENKGDLWNSVKYSFNDITSKEGLQEFIGGAITGLGTHLVGKVSDVTGISDKFAELTGGETKKQELQRKQEIRSSVLDLVNNSAINIALKDQGVADLFRSALLSKDIIKYNKENNLFEANNARHLGLYNLIWSAVHSGKDDFIINAFNKYGDQADIKTIANLLKIDENSINKDNLKEITNSIVDKIKETRNNFRGIEEHFNKTGIRQDLMNSYKEELNKSFDYDRELKKKYGIDLAESITEHEDKFSEQEIAKYNVNLANIESKILNIHAYDEAVKIAVVSYQSLKDSKNIVEKLTSELNNNNVGLNYSEALNLMDKKSLRALRNQIETSLSLATEPSDKKKYQKQLDILNSVNSLLKNNNVDIQELAKLMHKFSLANIYDYNIINSNVEIAMFEKSSNYMQKLEDIVKHQHRTKENLDIFNYLHSANNFEKYRKYSYEKSQEFFNRVYEYKKQIEKQEETITSPVKESEIVENKPLEKTPIEGTYLLSEEIENQIKEIKKKEDLENYNISIYVDNDGKHHIDAEYTSSLYGKLEENKRLEIENKFKSYLEKLDKELKKEKEIAANKQLAEELIKEYEEKLKDYKNQKFTNEEISKIESEFLEKLNNIPVLGTREYDPMFNNITSEIFNLPLKEEDEEENIIEEGYVPKEIIENTSTKEEKEIVNGKRSSTLLKSTGNETKDVFDENGNKIGEKLSDDFYNNFLRNFKLYFPKIQNLFLSADVSEEDITYRLVVKTETLEDQVSLYGKSFPETGQVLGVQIKDENGKFVDAYFDGVNKIVSIEEPGYKKIHLPIPKGTESNKKKALEALLKTNNNIENPEEQINLEVKQIKNLRIDSFNKKEPQVVFFDEFVLGIHVSENNKQKKNILDLLTTSNISTENLSITIVQPPIINGTKSKLSRLNGRTVFSGSAHVKIGNYYIEINPNQIRESDSFVKELDDLMNYTFDYIVGEDIPKEAISLQKYLSTFIYTNKEVRQFFFNKNTNKIELVVKGKEQTPFTSISEYLKDSTNKPIYLNISKHQVNSPIKFEITNGKLTGPVSYPVSEYTKFILKNSYTIGDFDLINNVLTPRYVNSYIKFSPIIEKAEIEQEKVNHTKEALTVLSEKELVVDTTDKNKYVNKADKKESFHRVSILKGKFNGKGDAADRGTIIDSLLRDFISKKISSLEELKEAYNKHEDKSKVGLFTDNFLQDLYNTFDNAVKYFEDQNIELITDVSSLWGQLDGTKFGAPKGNYAGTVDILGIKPDGSLIIIDLKTSSQDRTDLNNNFYKGYKKDDSIQQSAYAELLRQRTGITVDSVYVLPIQVEKDRTTGEYVMAIPNLSSTGDFTMVVDINEDLFPKVPNTPMTDTEMSDGGMKESSDYEEPPFKLKKNTDIIDLINIITENNPSEELEYVKKISGKVGLKVLFEVANSKYWGKFTTAAVTLTEGAIQGTGYHESFHVFSQIFLTKEQKEQLYKEARKKVKELKDALPIDVEEYLAEDFREFMLSGKSKLFKTDKEKTIFEKMVDFLKKVIGTFSIEKVYHDLKIGDLYEYKPSVSNAYWGHLNSVKKLEDIPLDRLIVYSKHVDSMVGIVMNEPITISGKNTPIVIASSYTVKAALENPKIKKLIEKEIYNNIVEISENATKSVKQDLELILNNWKEFLVFNSNYSKNSFSLVTDEEIEEESKFRDEVYDKANNETSLYEIGNEAVKQMLNTVPKCVWKNGSWEIVRDRNGFIQPSNTKLLWGILASELNSNLTPDSFFSKITVHVEENGKTIKNPEYVKLVRKIPELGYIVDNLLPKEIKYQNQLTLRQAFFHAFSKPEVPIISIVQDIDTNSYYERIETKNNRKAIQNRAYINFQGISEKTNFYKKGIVEKTEGKNKLGYDFIEYAKNLNLENRKDKLEFLKLLGFELPSYISVEAGDEFNALTTPLQNIALSLSERIFYNEEIINPIAGVKKDFYSYEGNKEVNIVSENSSVEKILEFMSKYTTEDPSNSYVVPGGKTKYGIQEYNRITRTNYWLSKTKNYEEILNSLDQYQDFRYLDVDNYSIARGSLFLKLMFGKEVNIKSNLPRKTDNLGNPISIQIEAYNGIDIKIDGKSQEQKEVFKLNEREKFIMDFNSFLKNGKINMLQNSSKKTYYSMSLSDRKLIFPIDVVNSVTNPFNLVDFQNIWKGYLEAELFKVGSKKYEKMNLDKFSFFDFLDKDIKEKLKKEAKEVKDGNFMKVVENNISEIAPLMNDYFEIKVTELSKKRFELGITDKDISIDLTNDYSLDVLTKAFIINHYIIAMEEMKLFRADPQFYSDFYKRTGQDISTGTHAIVDNDVLDFIEKTGNNTFSAFAGRNKSRKELSEASFITIADQEESIPVINPSNLNVGKKTNLPKIVEDTAYSLQKIYDELGIEKDAYSEENINTLIKDLIENKYNKVKITDGGGRCTLDFYRRVMQAVNNWGVEKEALFQALLAEDRLYKGQYSSEEEKQKLIKDMEINFKIAKNTVFNIAKLQVNTITIINGVEIPILHKFSLAPIFPKQVRGKEIGKIHEKLLSTGIDYIPFTSSSKAYTPNIIDLIKNNKITLEQFDEKTKTALQLSDVKEQIITASKYKENKRLGVQVAQLLFTNLFNEGKPIDFKGSAEEFWKTPYKELSPIGKIFIDYIESFEKIRKDNKKLLYKELGISEDSKGNIEIKDVKNIVKKLNQLANERDANFNVKDYISYDEKTKDFLNPLEFSINIDEIKKLINGLIDRRLRQMNVLGSMSIQLSDFGEKETNHDFRNATDKEKLKYGANGLPFYYLKKDVNGKVITSKMGVKITMTGQYKNLFNLPEVKNLVKEGYNELDVLNNLLKDEKWRSRNEELLTIVGYRIPTQGPNSMDVMVIHEFLPEYMGNTIILPAGVTTKSGTDYDIDKMSLFFKHIDRSGNLIKELSYNQKNNISEKLKNIFKELQETNNTLVDYLEKYNTELLNLSDLKNSINDIEKEIKESLEIADYEELEKLKEKEKMFNADLKEVLETKSFNETVIKDVIKKRDELLKDIKHYKQLLSNSAISQNKLVNSFEKVLTNPSMFYHLVKPNNTDVLEPLSKEIGNLVGKETKKFKNSEVIEYLSSLNKHTELMEGKNLLGVYATNNKLSQNFSIANTHLRFFKGFTKTGISILEKIQNSKSDEEKEKLEKELEKEKLYMRNPLLTEEEEKEMVDENKNYKISSIFNLDGRFSQESLSEGINMTVDIESNPFARTLGLNKNNVGVAVYLQHKKVPDERIWYFLNQPILLELYKDLNVTGNLNLSLSNITTKFFGEDYSKLYLEKMISEADAVKLTRLPFSNLKSSLEYLKREKVTPEQSLIKDNVSKNLSEIKFQKYVLAYFITANNEARNLERIRKNTNFDSNKIEGILAINAYNNDRNEILKDKNYIISNPNDFYKKSLVMMYDELKTIGAINKKMFPISTTPLLSELLNTSFKPNRPGITQVGKIKAEKNLIGDFIFSIVQNFGLGFKPEEYSIGNIVIINNKKGIWKIINKEENKYVLENGKESKEIKVEYNDITSLSSFHKLNHSYLSLIDKNYLNENEKLMYDELKDLKEKYPELEVEFPVIKRLVPNLNKSGKIVNIELFKGDVNETSDQNSYIQQFKKLTNHENPEISNLFNDLMVLAYIQSGYNMSPIYFSNVLDIDNLLKFFKKSNFMFNKIQEASPEFISTYIEAILPIIKRNNPSLYKKKEDEFFNSNYWRYKDYSIDMGELYKFDLDENYVIGSDENNLSEEDFYEPIENFEYFEEGDVFDLPETEEQEVIEQPIVNEEDLGLNTNVSQEDFKCNIKTKK